MRRSPLLTLVLGLVFAVGLLIVSSVAVSKRVPTAAGSVPSTSSAPSVAPSSPPPLAKPADQVSAAPSSPPPLAKVNAVWAGEVDGGGASIAISVKDGIAVAYLCDGKKTEIWLQGTAENGKLSLVSKKGAVLTGTFGGGKASGTITNNGQNFSFTDIPAAQPPSGLYRATENVRNAQVVCGWIRLQNGRTVGICDTNGTPAPAPPLDTSRTSRIDPKALP